MRRLYKAPEFLISVSILELIRSKISALTDTDPITESVAALNSSLWTFPGTGRQFKKESRTEPDPLFG
jgi:hypothetical protein